MDTADTGVYPAACEKCNTAPTDFGPVKKQVLNTKNGARNVLVCSACPGRQRDDGGGFWPHTTWPPTDFKRVRSVNECRGCGEAGHFLSSCPTNGRRVVTETEFNELKMLVVQLQGQLVALTAARSQ